jgi:antitoxin FitA
MPKPIWLQRGLETDAPTTLTLKNIPDEVYERLKAAAAEHRRSLNSEAIVCLQSVLRVAEVSPAEHLERARQIRAELEGLQFRAEDVDSA